MTEAMTDPGAALHARAARERIERRAAALRREWSVERALAVTAAALAVAGVALGTRDRRFLLLPVAAAAFLVHHALRGSRLPAAARRRLGLRLRREIEAEEHALARRRDADRAARSAEEDIALALKYDRYAG